MNLLFFIGTFSLMTYIFDVITDLMLVYTYYAQKATLEGSLTLTFVILPCVGVLLDRFYRDKFLQSCTCSKTKICEVLSGIRDALLIFYTTIKIYCQIIYHSWFVMQRHPDRDIHRKSIQKLQEDAYGIRFYESTFEALPQLILQTILIMTDIHNLSLKSATSEVLRLISIGASLISISWGITSYVSRYPVTFIQSEDDTRMPVLEKLLNFIGHVFILGANVLALSLAVHNPHKAIFVIIAIRMLIMLTWRKCDKEKRVLKNFSQIVLILLGICVPSDDGDFCFTYRSYLLVFGCDVIQNSSFILVWYSTTSLVSIYQVTFIIGHYISLMLGFLFMILFYWKYQIVNTKTIKKKSSVSEITFEPKDSECNELSHMPTNTDDGNSDDQRGNSFTKVEL